jgi:hypothetical protein
VWWLKFIVASNWPPNLASCVRFHFKKLVLDCSEAGTDGVVSGAGARAGGASSWVQRWLRYLSVCLDGGEAPFWRMPTALDVTSVCETFSK